MFRTSGYFRGINCPFFASGLCERPYCHFRHVKLDDAEDKTTTKTQVAVTGPSTSQSSTYLDNLSDGQFPLTSNSLKQSISENDREQNGELIQDISKVENKSAGHRNNDVLKEHVQYNKYTGEPIRDSDPLPVSFSVNKYTGELVPDGVESMEYSVSEISVNKYTGKELSQDIDDSAVPEKKWKELLGMSTPTYNPTPLTELKKRNADPTFQKYSLSSSKNISSNQEYDPESNYSTKTSVSHTLPVRQVDDRPSSYSRSVSYDPTNVNHGYKVSAKRERGLSWHFGESKFSSDDEAGEEDSLNEKDACKSSNHNAEVKYSLKDAKFFEKLLDDHKNSESDDSLDSLESVEEGHQHIFDKSILNKEMAEVKSAKQKSLNDRTNLEMSIKNSVTCHKQKHLSSITNISSGHKSSHHKDHQEKSRLSSNTDSKKTSSKSHHQNNHEKLSKLPHTDSKKASSKTHHEDRHEKSSKRHDQASSKQESSKSHHQDNHEKSLKSHEKPLKSHEKSLKNHEKSSKPHHTHDKQGSSNTHHHANSNRTSHHSEKDSSNSTSTTKHRKSSQETNETILKPSSEKSRHSSGKKSSTSLEKTDIKKAEKHRHSSESKGDNKSSSTHHKHSSSKNGETSKHSSSKNGETSKHKVERHSSKSGEKVNSSKHSTSKEKPEKIRRNSSEVTKKKIVDINVNLFGSDSDENSGGEEKLDSPVSNIDMEFSAFFNEEFSDEDRYEECLRIFEESKRSPVKKHIDKKKLHSSPVKEPEAVSAKKRFAHKADTEVKRKAPEVVKTKLSPAEVMHNRFLELQKRAREAATNAAAEANTHTASSSGGRKRTAHQISSASNSKSTSLSTSAKQQKLTITTAAKSEKRKAHMPTSVASLTRPTIPTEFGSKVPTNVRQRYLNLIIDECLKLCNTEKEAYDRGLLEESAVYKRSSSRTVYLNVAVNTIKRLRTELSENSPSTSKKAKQANVLTLSHEAILGGKNATKTSFTVNRSGGGTKLPQENFKGAELYKRLSVYILEEQQQKDNGFPRESLEVPGDAVFFTESKRKINSSKLTNYEKLCVRCGKTFIVYPNGTYPNKEECIHHWGKAWKKKIAGYLDTRYTCCQGDLSSEGCQVAKAHVHETNKWQNLSGYMKTLPCSPPIDGDYGVFAMDCEMVYTKAGIELARVTVTDPENECVYESLVKPDKPVLDYNTRFSGLTEEDLQDVTTSLRDVQAVLLSLFSDKTIVMGHSLESDLSAVKLIHNTVVDTSVVFPHRLGPPYKRALKTLMAEFLKKIIQDDVGGHDSKEDATSCMELMHLKIKEDARREAKHK